MPFGSTTKNKQNKQADQIATYIIGLVGSYQFSETFSLDFNLQLQDYFSSHKDLASNDLFLYIDFGKYVGRKIYILQER